MVQSTDLQSLLAQSTGIRLDLGCGAHKQAGFVGVDMRPLEGVDIVWDLEDIPWSPIPDECAWLVMASHLVEHINPARGGFLRFMDEVWRVTKVGGQLAIATPHGASPGYLQDPTHCNPCSEATWAYFDPCNPSKLYSIYRPKPWQLCSVSFQVYGNMEVVLKKRAEAESYD